jgi:acyl dehydratase
VWEDVKVGDVLPTLVHPITIKTMVMAVCGTRDFSAYHHDRDYSKAVGNPDMFVNTMFNQALLARFVTDWTGPDSDFREATLQMRGVLCPGDVAKVEGQVADKSMAECDGDRRVTIEISLSGDSGVAASGTTVLAMPSRESEQSEPAWGGYPISEAQIGYWCEMVEDANPLYVDGDYARMSRHKGVIAPPVGLLTWAMPPAGHHPDINCPERKLWPPVEAGHEPFMRQPPGVSEAMVQQSRQTYGKPLRPGDRVYTRSEVVDCSPLKETRVGPGYFQTQLDTYYNQDDEIVGTDVLSMLWYGGSKKSIGRRAP